MASTPPSVTSSPSPAERQLIDIYQLVFTKPCPTCGCNLSRSFYEYLGCVRCYPGKDYHEYAQIIDALYPRRRNLTP